jgi:hypothetical protein
MAECGRDPMAPACRRRSWAVSPPTGNRRFESINPAYLHDAALYRGRAPLPLFLQSYCTPQGPGTRPMNKKIRVNAFDMNCVGHIQHGSGPIRATARPSTTRSNTGRTWRGWRNAASSTGSSWLTASASTTSTAAARLRRLPVQPASGVASGTGWGAPYVSRSGGGSAGGL